MLREALRALWRAGRVTRAKFSDCAKGAERSGTMGTKNWFGVCVMALLCLRSLLWV